jgi:probable rRNA maturation factor
MIIFRKTVSGLSEAALERFVTRAQRLVGLHGEVNVLVTDNEDLQALNSRFRGKHAPTDVLSFPAIASAEGVAGDVAISADLAVSNARRLGHAAAEEVKILALHGILHLASYDHEQDQGEMAQREHQLRRQLGLPVGLIERYHPRNGSRRRALDARRRAVASKERSKVRSAARTAPQKAR